MADEQSIKGINGGQIAFCGFLYQIVGTLGLRAWAECRDQTAEYGKIEGLLDFVLTNDLYHEVADRDAFIQGLSDMTRGDSIVVQFKFSLKPLDHPLRPADFAEICRRFHQTASAQQRKPQSGVKYFVITNRPLSTELHPIILDQAPDQRQFIQLEKPQATRRKKRADDTDHECLTAILQRTEVVEGLHFERFERQLRAFAAEYGVHGGDPERPERDSEFDRGLRELIGALSQQAAWQDPYPITADFLAQTFRGYSAPRKLTVTAVEEYTRESRRTISGELGVHGHPIRRRLLEQVLENADDHAFVVLSGPGGNGKSVLGWQAVEAAFADGIAQHPVAGAFLSAHDVEPHALSWIAGEWANVPAHKRTESNEEVITRLRIANRGARPVFCLCLDGLDEVEAGHPHARSIESLLRWFWKQEEDLLRQRHVEGSIAPPEATLIVTCRDEQDEVISWLGGRLSPAFKETPPKPIPIPEFTPEEIVQAARSIVPRQAARIEDAVDPLFSRPDGATGRSSLSPVVGRSILHPDVRAALAHPVMWYAISGLPDEQVDAMLDGRLDALDALAGRFIEWFTDKVTKRRRVPEDQISYVLQAVSRHATAMSSAELPYGLWRESSRQAGLSDLVGTHLYREARSAGLIEEVSLFQRWSWRHPFVAQYLARVAEKEGWPGA